MAPERTAKQKKKAAAADALDPAKDAKAKKKTKKVKPVTEAQNETSTPATADSSVEERRRECQRELQQLVVKMKAEGKSKIEIEAAKREMKAAQGSFQKPQNAKQRKLEKYKDFQSRKDVANKVQAIKDLRKKRRHEVVVIPVIWRGRQDHKGILGAAEDIKSCLANQGLDAWIDARRQYTPGQKFAHWEHRGVMLRVEVGPQDFAKGICQVCKAKTPGDYESVEKKKVRLPPSGARALLLALKEFGVKIEIERREGDSEDEGDEVVAPRTAPAAAKRAAPASDDVGDVGGNWEPRVQPKKAKKQRGK